MQNYPHPYKRYSDGLKERFGCKVYKLTLDAGFNCPNRDGTKGIGGCTFCDETGSSSRAQDKRDSITEQLLKNIDRLREQYKAQKFIAYFQSFTNTYDSVDRLKALYDEALAAHPDIIGLSISTRPDCIDEEKMALIASYKGPDSYLSLEYGMQTIHDRSLALVNRCETHEDFIRAYTLSKAYDIPTCVHVILGMPGESHADMMATADRLAELRVEGVKIHLLCAMRHTPLAAMYERGEWTPMTQEQYVGTLCNFIERLHPDTAIHRVSGNGHREALVAPEWLVNKFEVMMQLDREFLRRGTRQGSLIKQASFL